MVVPRLFNIDCVFYPELKILNGNKTKTKEGSKTKEQKGY